jgi:tetratricopeptide (TPR) repeat protein
MGMALLYYHLGAAGYHSDLNRCAPALPLLERSLVWLEKAIGLDAYGPTEMADRLGRCYIERGRYADAERHLKRAISIGERTPGAANGWFREFRTLLAGLYEAQGYDLQAKAIIKDAGLFPTMVPSARSNVTTLASEYVQTGQHAKAEALYKEELARLEDTESHSPTRAAIAALQDKLDAISGWSAEAQKARQPLFQELLRLQQTVPTAERIATVRHALGVLDQKQGRYAEAEALFREALARLEKASVPAIKAAVAAMQDKLKTMGWSAEEIPARKALARESWRLQETLPTEDQIARVLHSLGRLYHEQGKHAEAEAHLKRAIGFHEHLDHAEQISLQLSLARLHADQQRYGDAESAYGHVLALYAKRDRHAHGSLPTTATASVLKSLGALALKQGQADRAEDLHKRALKVLEDLGPDRFDVARMLNDLAEVYRSQRRFAEAEPLYRRALGVCAKGDMSPNHELVRTALANLAALYFDQGRTFDLERLKRGPLDAGSWLR